jgi:hypothetical protein
VRIQNSFSILKQPEHPRRLEGSGILHVLELFSPWPICSTRASLAERDKAGVLHIV